jgi:hypothetical protein
MSRDEVVAKARELMSPALGDKVCAKLIERVLQLDGVKDVRDLRPLLRSPDRSQLFHRSREESATFDV